MGRLERSMTLDQAVALSSLKDHFPSAADRPLLADDPDARARRPLSSMRAPSARARSAGDPRVAWNDPRFPLARRHSGRSTRAVVREGLLDAGCTSCGDRRIACRHLGAPRDSCAAGERFGRAGITVGQRPGPRRRSAAHRGALTVGLTIAVLGSGARSRLSARARTAGEQIARTGSFVSEYPPGTRRFRTTFRCATVSSAGCRSPSWSSRRRRSRDR